MEAPPSLFGFHIYLGSCRRLNHHAAQTHACWEAEGKDGLFDVSEEEEKMYVFGVVLVCERD